MKGVKRLTDYDSLNSPSFFRDFALGLWTGLVLVDIVKLRVVNCLLTSRKLKRHSPHQTAYFELKTTK